MAKKIKSVFQNSLNYCFYSDSPQVHRHHIFGSFNRTKSEKYGYVIAVRHDLHIYGKESIHENPNSGKDLELKQMAYNHFLENHGTRDDFIAEFGRAYEE